MICKKMPEIGQTLPAILYFKLKKISKFCAFFNFFCFLVNLNSFGIHDFSLKFFLIELQGKMCFWSRILAVNEKSENRSILKNLYAKGKNGFDLRAKNHKWV